MRNPRTEIRNPREARTPKSELAGCGVEACADSRSGVCEEGGATESFVLREEVAGSPRPNLLERTALFAEAIIRFAKKVPRGPVTNRLIDQIVGAGSSVAANYCEADDSVSGKDFRKSIGTCRKESKETMLFLRMIATAEENLAPEARRLWCEAKELNLIFGAIWRKCP